MLTRSNTILGYRLKREIDAACSAITRAACHVSFKGRQAYTDGRNIVLPAVDDATLYELDAANVLRGYGDHEGAHHIFTPMDLITELRNGTAGMNLQNASVQKQLAANPPPKTWLTRVEETFNLWNASEDWRIEHHLMRLWPGTRINLSCTRGHINERENRMMTSDARLLLDPFKTASAILTWLNATTNDYPCAALAQETLDLTERENPELHSLVSGYWPRITATADLDNASANRAIYAAAQELCDRLIAIYLKDEPPPEPEKKPGQNPGQTGSSSEQSTADDPGTGSGTGQGQGSDPGGAQDQPPDQPSESPAEKAEREKAAQEKAAREQRLADARDAAQAHSPEKRDQLDIGDVLEKINAIADAIEAEGGEISDRPIAEALIRIPRKTDTVDLKAYHDTQASVGAVTSSLAGSIRSLVIAKDRRRTSYNRDDGELDMRNVIGLALGATDVYSHTVVHKGNNTAIEFLLDISASMRLRRGKAKQLPIEIAGQSIVSITEALGPAKRVVTRYDAYTSDEGEHNRLHNLKDFHENVVTGKTHISHLIRDIGLSQVKMGGTPTGEMLLEAWDVLRPRRESKKVIMLITDGEPSDEGLANRAAATIKADGGRLIGIAVGAGEPQFDLDHWVLVPQIEDLPIRMMGAIRPLIGPVT